LFLPGRYGDVADLEEYKGGRDFDALKKFADEKLKVKKQILLQLCLFMIRVALFF
jgi:hypothetical protein